MPPSDSEEYISRKSASCQEVFFNVDTAKPGYYYFVPACGGDEERVRLSSYFLLAGVK
jgi:hypothetical protein